MTDREELMSLIDSTDTLTLLKGLIKGANLEADQYDGLVICFVLQIVLEERLNLIIRSTIHKGFRADAPIDTVIDPVIDELTFSGKLNIFEKWIKTNEQMKTGYQSYVSFCRRFNNEIRNRLFHVKLTKIEWNKKPLSEVATQKALIKEFFQVSEYYEKS